MKKFYNSNDFCKLTRRVLIAKDAQNPIVNKNDVYFNDDFHFSIPTSLNFFYNYYIYKYPVKAIEIENNDVWAYSYKPMPISPFILAALTPDIRRTLLNDPSFLMASVFNPKTTRTSNVSYIYAYFLTDFGNPKEIEYDNFYCVGKNKFIEVYQIELPEYTKNFLTKVLLRKFNEIDPTTLKQVLENTNDSHHYSAVRALANKETYTEIPLLTSAENHWKIPLRY